MYPWHRSHIALATWLAFMVGVAHLPQLVLYLGSCAIAALATGWKRWLLLAWLVACGLVGAWRYDSYAQPPVWTDGAAITQTGTIVQPPTLHDGQQRLVIQLEGGRVQADTATYPQYHYGDVVQLDCQIRLPQAIEEFAYDKYLARYHIVAICDYPVITVLATQQGHSLLAMIYDLRLRLRQQVEQLWAEPVAALMLGVLIGEQDTIPEAVYTAFQRSGTVHILVVSGMHVLIIIQLLTRFTRWLPRLYQTLAILLLLGIFCVLTGLSATVIRAVLMGTLPLLGKVVGRPSSIHLALTWAAGIMTLLNPYILVHDVGFQLSFLATLGLVYMTPFVEKFTQWLPQSLFIRETVTTSLAAMTTTAPWIAYVFGTWSNVAILANLVVVPVSNLMLLAGAPIVALSTVLPVELFATLLGSIVRVMLHYVEWCAALPSAYVQLW